MKLMMYLVVIELAVLQVGRGGDGAHTGISVVVRVLTHTVWEAFLQKKMITSALHVNSTDER